MDAEGTMIMYQLQYMDEPDTNACVARASSGFAQVLIQCSADEEVPAGARLNQLKASGYSLAMHEALMAAKETIALTTTANSTQ